MWNPWAESDARRELSGRLKWFLLGRVAVLSCFFFVVAFGYLGRGEQGYLISIESLLFIVGLAYAVTLVSALLIDRLEDLTPFTYCQLGIDLLLITGAIYLTSGVDSPFAFLYSLAVINGAVLLFSNGAVVTAVAATVLYDALLIALATGTIEVMRPHELPPIELDATLLARIVATNLTFFLTAFLSGFLTKRIFQAEHLLAQERAERDRVAILKDTLAQAIGSSLVTTDPEGCILTIDSAGTGTFEGSSAESLRGRDIGDLFPALKLTPSARLRFLQSPDAIEPIEFAHQRDGLAESMELRCSTAPLRDTFGHTIGALYVFQDITALRRADDPAQSPAVAEICAPSSVEDLPLDDGDPSDGLYGRSGAILELRNLIARVSNSDATILITGESGTGKEVVARAIHAQGCRREKHFVAINCGAIPENLIESELFGHVKGAFTGASADRIGSFRMADGGTIFLDEIGELPLHLQVKLLRVLQERTFRPVGSEISVAVNVRVIAATNRDLPEEVRAGRFREDLFYRLNVIELVVPPLRERSEDIPLLVRHFLKQFSAMHGRHIARFSTEAAHVLLDYDYPGNVRELENIVEHAVAMGDGETAEIDHLPAYLAEEASNGASPPRSPRPGAQRDEHDPSWTNVDLERDLAEYEKNFLLRALNEAGGVKKKAAELLGINYRSLRHRLQKYGLGDIGPGSSTVQ
jgi:transcriptional regulator with PAS, ATPase and Fis domain